MSSAVLPRAGQYSSLAAIGGKLIVWGGDEGDIDSVPTATSGTATCQAAVVDPRTLALSDVRHGNCLNPALYRERVLPDLVTTRGGTTGAIGALRISVASAPTHGGFTLGPVLERYEECSDCGLSMAYGDGSLWIYAPNLLGGSLTRGRLLRISERTGRVLQRWSLPSLARALLATDRDGLWLAPSFFSGYPEHATAAQRRDAESLYRVSPAAGTLQRTFLIGPGGARWLVASGASVWLDTGTPTATRLIRLEGPDGRRAFAHREGAPTCLEFGDGPTSIAGDASAGIYCLGDGAPVSGTAGSRTAGSGTVYRFGAGSGVGRSVATIPGLDSAEFLQPGVVLGSTYFLLQPPEFAYGPAPAERATAQGPGVLYRIRARQPGGG